MRQVYCGLLFLIIELFVQSSFAAAECSDGRGAPRGDIQTVIEEYRQYVQQTMMNFAATPEIRAAWYENARLHFGCSFAAGLSAFYFAQQFIFARTMEVGSLWRPMWDWLLDCEQNNSLRESECSYASNASFVSWFPAALFIAHKCQGPAQNWVKNKAQNLMQDLIRREVRRRVTQRFLVLEREDAARASIQDRASEELRNRIEEIHQLDNEMRKSIFQIASWVGDISLMRAVLKADNPNEAVIIALLDNLDVCPICRQSFNEKSVDGVVVRGCDARHCFHKSCLKNWYESSGESSCPMCLDKAKPNTQELLDCLNRGIQSEIVTFSLNGRPINGTPNRNVVVEEDLDVMAFLE